MNARMHGHVVVTSHGARVREDCTLHFESVVMVLHALLFTVASKDARGISQLWGKSMSVAHLFVRCTGTFACEAGETHLHFLPCIHCFSRIFYWPSWSRHFCLLRWQFCKQKCTATGDKLPKQAFVLVCPLVLVLYTYACLLGVTDTWVGNFFFYIFMAQKMHDSQVYT